MKASELKVGMVVKGYHGAAITDTYKRLDLFNRPVIVVEIGGFVRVSFKPDDEVETEKGGEVLT